MPIRFGRSAEPPFWWKPWLHLYFVIDWWYGWHRPRRVRKP